MRLDPSQGWVPANYTPDGPYEGFWGQFDPFGDWSMANSAGEWNKVYYISSVSETPCVGPNCVSTLSGGFLNSGHFAGNTRDRRIETMLLDLIAGNYMIAVDGEACANLSDSRCINPRYNGTVQVSLQSLLPQPVPLPGAAWFFASALASLGELACRKRKGNARSWPS